MIADWAELVVEVSQRAKDGSVMNRAQMLTGLAEADLNKMLRTADMEAQATVTTDANGETPLPTGFAGIRAVSVNGKRLASYPLAQVRAGGRCGYAIVGQTLVSTEVSTDIDLDYYAALPGLVANGTNWLLQSDPEIYLYALLKQAYLAGMNIEAATAAGSYLGDLIGRKQIDDAQRRFGATSFSFGGIAP